jgi:hypothetical protein
VTALNQSTRAWLARVALSLGIALGVGALAYLVTRAITGAALFVRHQQLLREAASAMRGGVEGLASGDLRAVRLLLQQSDEWNQLLSLAVGFAVAGLAAVSSYLWLERRGARADAEA